MRSFILVALLFGIISCQTYQEKYDISRVDSISTRLEDMASVYLKIDTLKVDSFNKIVLANIYKLNTLNEPSDLKLLINYGTLKKGFKAFNEHKNITLQELEFTRNQLNNLKEDAGNGLLKGSEFELYLKHEENAAQNLRVQMSYYYTMINSHLDSFDTLNPKIEFIIDSLSKIK